MKISDKYTHGKALFVFTVWSRLDGVHSDWLQKLINAFHRPQFYFTHSLPLSPSLYFSLTILIGLLCYFIISHNSISNNFRHIMNFKSKNSMNAILRVPLCACVYQIGIITEMLVISTLKLIFHCKLVLSNGQIIILGNMGSVCVCFFCLFVLNLLFPSFSFYSAFECVELTDCKKKKKTSTNNKKGHQHAIREKGN